MTVMSSVNIRRDVQDSFYRYKMPRLISKIEGKGNGIKTVIPNMTEIAKALARPPTYPTKFFGCELGAQVKFDFENNKFIVNGAHDAPKLQSLLDVFIDKFVLCAACSNPETDLILTKDGDIFRNCVACGQRTLVDMRHKLVTFIVKNPPSVAAESKLVSAPVASAAASSKKTRKSKKGVKKDQSSDEEENMGDEDQEENDEEIAAKIEEEAAALEGAVESQLDDWSAPVSQESLSDNVARRLMLDDNDDDENEGDDPFEALATYVEEHASASSAEILQEVQRLGLRADKAAAVLFQVLLGENIIQQLQDRQEVFSHLIQNEKGQKAVLGGMERLVGVNHPETLMPKVPLILKALYDLDLVEEEVILAWGKKPSKKYVSKDVSKEIRKKAEPFLQWLATAEEESSEEEDD